MVYSYSKSHLISVAWLGRSSPTQAASCNIDLFALRFTAPANYYEQIVVPLRSCAPHRPNSPLEYATSESPFQNISLAEASAWAAPIRFATFDKYMLVGAMRFLVDLPYLQTGKVLRDDYLLRVLNTRVAGGGGTNRCPPTPPVATPHTTAAGTGKWSQSGRRSTSTFVQVGFAIRSVWKYKRYTKH